MAEQHDTAAPSSGPAVAQEVPEIEGLDTRNGLARLGGNRSLYLKLLNQFLDLESSPARIASALGAGDWSQAELTAHTVKGAAGGLGASSVEAVSSHLERALRERQEKEVWSPRLLEFDACLSEFCARLRAALPSRTQAPLPLVPLDKTRAHSLATELDSLLRDFDTGALELFEAQRDQFPALLGRERFAVMEQQLANFTFAEARTTLRLAAAERGIDLP
jgi:two-component system sensor histidine kinase/response regulator